MPIDFFMEYASMQDGTGKVSSRVQKDHFKFEEGDVIHISAVFSLLGGETKTEYDCLELKNGQWISKESSDPNTPSKPMMWPWDTETATFQAYYLAHSSGILNEVTDRLLDSVRTEADPLFAKTENIKYGGAVRLSFEHLCTKLTVTGLQKGESEFWLRQDNLKDLFSLTRDNNNSLSFGFYESTEEQRPGLDRRVAGMSDGEGNATFYLAPGDYSDISIDYNYGLSYLKLSDIQEFQQLKANTSYVLNIKTGSGNVDQTDEEDRWTDPDDSDYVKLDTEDINKLLLAIHYGRPCVTNNGIPILATNENGTVLLKNVDFQNNPFTWQILPNGTVFDGKYRYFKNVAGSAVFSQINGRVSNLGIVNGQLKVEKQSNDQNVGILSSMNSVSAVVSNVRLKDISISVEVPMIRDIANIGVLTGNNQGSIYGVKLGGDISVTVKSNNAMGRVHIGGLVGQSSGLISGTTLLDDETPADILVKCECTFPDLAPGDHVEGDRYVGGLVGLSTGRIENCMVSATVTAANSQGVLMYTGGIVGMLRGAEEGDDMRSESVLMSGSVASCDVTGGLAFPVDKTINGEGRSYTGGLIGYAYCVHSVTDCKSLGQVHGHDYKDKFFPYDNAYYGVGGAFGQIYGENSSITGVDARSQIVTKLSFADAGDVHYFIGLFAGRADRNYTAGNSSHNSGPYDFIGDIGHIHY